MINEYLDPNYLEEIKSKLDRLNKVSGVDPSQKVDKSDPMDMDPMNLMGAQAIKWIRSQGKDLNGNTIPDEPLYS